VKYLAFLLLVVGCYKAPQPTLAPKAPKIQEPMPDSLFIRGERWQIQSAIFLPNYAEPDSKTVASTDCPRRIILYSDLEKENYIKPFLWHEVFHAAKCDLPDK
jgi:hypothetical protein